MSRVDVIAEAIQTYGEEMQILVAIEELSELQKALTKWLRYRSAEALENISEEMADVVICLKELELMFDNRQKRIDWMAAKISRLKNRLEGQEDE